MENRIALFGHLLYQTLIVFPLVLLATSVIFDLIYIAMESVRWASVSYWMIVAGLIGGVVAIAFSLIDWRGLPSNTRAKSIGLCLILGNLLVVALFLVSWMIRGSSLEEPSNTALMLSAVGIIIGMITGWLDGELVDSLATWTDSVASEEFAFMREEIMASSKEEQKYFD
jgi:uncharacterized membrane protein